LNRNNYQTWQGNTFNCDNHQVGNHYPSSSKGPTRNGLNKPDISASGEWTQAANDLYWLNWAKTNNPNSLAIDTMHGPHKGTSAAAPVVSGAVALYFQKRPTASYLDVKAALTTCVLTDNFTGTSLPNNVWGYGKLDAFKMLNCQGCTNPSMSNYNSMAQIDDGSCVYLGPIPYFKHPNLSYCTNDSIHLIDSSSNNPSTWNWVFDAFANIQISTATNPVITYSKGGKHYINLTVSNNFGSKTYVDSIWVTATPSSNFTFVDNVCVGYNSIISYSGLTTSSAVYTYTFGGGVSTGSSSGPYLVNWATPGAKSITLNVVDNGCVSSSANTINVNAIPVAKFTFTKIGTAASFTNQSTGATTYSWAFGDGASSTSQHPIHYYTINGTYVITLLAQNGNCVNTFLDTIYITSASGIETKIIEKEDLIVNHNNTTSQLQIKWLGDASLKNIELYNIQGQLIYKQKNISANILLINTSSYASGMYLAKYETENGIIISKKWSIER
jgi:PKD repeat protein